jgi:hypothetical protein
MWQIDSTVLLCRDVVSFRGALRRHNLDQSAAQIAAAGGRPIRWYFAEPEAEAFAKELFKSAREGVALKSKPKYCPGRGANHERALLVMGPISSSPPVSLHQTAEQAPSTRGGGVSNNTTKYLSSYKTHARSSADG